MIKDRRFDKKIYIIFKDYYWEFQKKLLLTIQFICIFKFELIVTFLFL